MKRFIFGFQRRVWWPKCTPASSSCFMVTTATEDAPFPAVGLNPDASPPSSGGFRDSWGRRPWVRPGTTLPRAPCPRRRSGYSTAGWPRWGGGDGPPAPRLRGGVPMSAPGLAAGGLRGLGAAQAPRWRGPHARRECLRLRRLALVGGDPGTQLQDRLGVDLAHPAFR